jgi:hypothetical protein
MLGELDFLAAKISQVNVGDLVRFGAHARDSSIDVCAAGVRHRTRRYAIPGPGRTQGMDFLTNKC